MSEKEQKIMETFGKVIPKLSESDKSYLLGLGEGMSIKIRIAEETMERMETIKKLCETKAV